MNADSSPFIASISPDTSHEGLLTITGSNLNTDLNGESLFLVDSLSRIIQYSLIHLFIHSLDTKVFVGTAECLIETLNSTQIECMLGQSTAGVYAVLVSVESLGYSNTNVTFTYEQLVTDLSSVQGSTQGGLNLNLYGYGFGIENNVTKVKICNVDCPIVQSNYSLLTCVVRVLF